MSELITEIPKEEKIEKKIKFNSPNTTSGYNDIIIHESFLSENFRIFLQKYDKPTILDTFIKYIYGNPPDQPYKKFEFEAPFYSDEVKELKDKIAVTQTILDEVNKITTNTIAREYPDKTSDKINSTQLKHLKKVKNLLAVELVSLNSSQEELNEVKKEAKEKDVIIEQTKEEVKKKEVEVKKKEEDILKLEHITSMQVQIINEMKKIGESIKSDFDTTGASTREEQEKVNAALNIIEKKTDEKNDFIDKVKTWTALIGAIGTLTLGLVGALTPIILSLVNLSKKDKANSKDYLALINSLKKLQKQNLSPQLKSILDNIYDLHD